jgi:SMP-30/Gluconolactonase/LRE-like region
MARSIVWTPISRSTRPHHRLQRSVLESRRTHPLFADSWSGEIWAYDYDLDTGAVSNKRTFCKIDRSRGAAADGAPCRMAPIPSVTIRGARRAR